MSLSKLGTALAVGAIAIGVAACGHASSTKTVTQVQTVPAQSSAGTTQAANFVSRGELEANIRGENQQALTSSSATASDHVGPVSCSGPIGATATQEFWSCSYEVTYPYGHILDTLKATAYPDGSAIWGPGS